MIYCFAPPLTFLSAELEQSYFSGFDGESWEDAAHLGVRPHRKLDWPGRRDFQDPAQDVVFVVQVD